MTPFQNHVREILHSETAGAIAQHGFFLETPFCSMVCEKHNLALYTVRGTLKMIYPEMSLVKRRLSSQLKHFYNLDVKGCPIIYMPDTHTDNC